MASRKLVFVDTETTGLSREDRVVSLALISVDRDAFFSGAADAEIAHMAFNPQRPSDPRAAKVHGFTDWDLSHQDLFSDHVDLIERYLDGAIAIAHNCSFDKRFLKQEMALLGRARDVEFLCTMKGWRTKFPTGESAALKAILPRIGLSRSAQTHGAFEDAWLSMQVFRFINGLPPARSEDIPAAAYRPLNWKAPPPQPRDATAQRPRRRFESKEQFDYSRYPVARELIRRCTPLATLMLHVARADRVVARGEVDVLTELCETMSRQLGIAADADIIAEAVAQLYRLSTYDDELMTAVGIVRSDRYMRESLASWVRRIAMADGVGSTEEVAAITAIAKLFETQRGS